MRSEREPEEDPSIQVKESSPKLRSLTKPDAFIMGQLGSVNLRIRNQLFFGREAHVYSFDNIASST